MIATFEIITEFGTGDPAMLSGGIGEALITTQLGLVVAIPAVLLGNVLKGRQNEVLRMLEHAALTAINLRCDQQRPDDDQKLAAVATDAA
jgi:biopolymer transport protein ExbB